MAAKFKVNSKKKVYPFMKIWIKHGTLTLEKIVFSNKKKNELWIHAIT